MRDTAGMKYIVNRQVRLARRTGTISAETFTAIMDHIEGWSMGLDPLPHDLPVVFCTDDAAALADDMLDVGRDMKAVIAREQNERSKHAR